MTGPSFVDSVQDLFAFDLAHHQFCAHLALLVVQASPTAGQCPGTEQIRLQVSPVVAAFLMMDPDSIHLGLLSYRIQHPLSGLMFFIVVAAFTTQQF